MLSAIPWERCFSCVPYLLCYYQVLPLLSLSPNNFNLLWVQRLLCSHLFPLPSDQSVTLELCDEFASQLSPYPGRPLSHKPCHKPCKRTTSPCDLKEPPGAMHTAKDPGTHTSVLSTASFPPPSAVVFYANKTALPSTINYSLSLSISKPFFKDFVPHLLMIPLFWKNTMISLPLQMPGNLASVSVPRGLQEGTELAAMGAHVSHQLQHRLPKGPSADYLNSPHSQTCSKVWTIFNSQTRRVFSAQCFVANYFNILIPK